MYAEGRGRSADLTEALALYEQACRRGLKQVCELASQLRGSIAAGAGRSGPV
jgi:TPR repeat protein